MYVLCCFSVAYNNRMRQFVILDSKGITTWKRDQVDPRGKQACVASDKIECFQRYPAFNIPCLFDNKKGVSFQKLTPYIYIDFCLFCLI